jgi:hypothetical protein
MINEIAGRSKQINAEPDDETDSRRSRAAKSLSMKGHAATDAGKKQALVTIIRDCETLRGLAADVREPGLALQLEALIHHAGARLVAWHTGDGAASSSRKADLMADAKPQP